MDLLLRRSQIDGVNDCTSQQSNIVVDLLHLRNLSSTPLKLTTPMNRKFACVEMGRRGLDDHVEYLLHQIDGRSEAESQHSYRPTMSGDEGPEPEPDVHNYPSTILLRFQHEIESELPCELNQSVVSGFCYD